MIKHITEFWGTLFSKKTRDFSRFFRGQKLSNKIHMRQGDLQETGKYKPSLFFKWDDISKA